MNHRNRRRLVRCAIPLAMIIALCLIWQLALATPPRDGKERLAKPLSTAQASVFTGTVTIRVPLPDPIDFSYAVLYVDGSPKCVTNKSPLRFALDTTEISDGKHVLKTVLFDKGGIVKELTPSEVIVKNAPADATPANLTSGKAHEKTVLVKAPARIVTARASARAVATDAPRTTVAAAPVTSAPPAMKVTTPATQVKTPAASVKVNTPAPAKKLLAVPAEKLPVVSVNEVPASPSNKEDVAILLDEKPMNLEAPSYITSGRTMVLLRPIIEALGGSLTWKGKTGIAEVYNHQITFTLHHRTVLVDAMKFTLMRPLARHHQRVYAPITLWRDLFNGDVEYQNVPRQVKIYSLKKYARAKKSVTIPTAACSTCAH